MEDIFGFLFILVVFVLGPIIEQIRRKNQQPPPPPGQRPLPRSQRQMPRPRTELPDQNTRADVPERASRTEEFKPRPEYTQPYGTSEPKQAESAATMVPDELWEILTGRPKPRAPSRPVPEAEVDEDEQEWEKYQEAPRPEVSVEVRRPRDEAVLEDVRRHVPPVVVSLEAAMPSTKLRHAAFHERLSHMEAPVAGAPSAHRVRLFSKRGDLRRAIILQTVLGRPKALEDDPLYH